MSGFASVTAMTTIRPGEASNESPCAAVLSEFLEALIHQILFLRAVYHQDLFERQRLYNIAVRKAAHPGVVTYIHHLAGSLKDGVAAGTVRRIIVVLLSPAHQALEKFVLDLRVGGLDRVGSPLELEAALRSILLKLSMAGSALRPLPKGSSFRVLACAENGTQLPQEVWAEQAAPQDRYRSQQTDRSRPQSDGPGWGASGAGAAEQHYDIMAAHQITPIKTTSVAGSLQLQLYVDSSLGPP